MIAAYFGTPATSQVEASGYAVADGELWLVGHDDNTGIWKTRIDLRCADAIGSGSPFALTAMDMGASAYQAVEMAAKRDTSTGGKIRTLRVTSPGKG